MAVEPTLTPLQIKQWFGPGETGEGNGFFIADADGELLSYSFRQSTLPHPAKVEIDYGKGAKPYLIPSRDKWIFDSEEDWSPSGGRFSNIRENLIQRYVGAQGEGKEFSTLDLFKTASNEHQYNADKPDSLGSFASSPPYRVRVEWHDELNDLHLPDGLIKEEGDTVWIRESSASGGSAQLRQFRPDHEAHSIEEYAEYRIPPKVVSFPAFTLEGAERIYETAREHYPDHISLLKLDWQTPREKWAVVLDEDGNWALVDEETDEDYRESLQKAISSLGKDTPAGRKRPKWFEMSGDDGKDMFFESASEGEVDFKKLYDTGSFTISSTDSRGAEMHSVDIDLGFIPTAGSAGWALDGDIQEGPVRDADLDRSMITTVVKEEAADNYEIAVGAVKHDPPWDNPRKHTFQALWDASPPLPEISPWDQDDVLDQLEAGRYGPRLPSVFGEEYANRSSRGGKMLPYDLSFVAGVERPVLFPSGELTMMPSLGPIDWYLHEDGPDGALASLTSHQIHTDNTVQVGGRGRLKEGQSRFSPTTFKFARTFKNSRGKKLRYESKPAGMGLVIWKTKRHAQLAGTRARELGWLIRTVPVNDGWVNLGNLSRLKSMGKQRKTAPTYWRVKE